MGTNPGPVTDFFGTRLIPDALVEELASLGLSNFAVVLTDEGAVLRLTRGHDEDAAARAVTRLRGRFSPFLTIGVEAVPASKAPARNGSFIDERRRRMRVVVLAEIWDEAGLPRAAAGLLSRLGLGGSASAAAVHVRVEDWGRARDAVRASSASVLMSWRRPGGAAGSRPAIILAASLEPRALEDLAALLADDAGDVRAPRDLLLDGLEWGVARRPTVAAFPSTADAPPIAVDARRCSGCGTCAAVCPSASLGPRGAFVAGGAQRCISCFDCVEACPVDALRPVYGASSATTGRSLACRPGWLSRLRGAAGPPLPAPFPPSFLLPKPRAAAKPRRILGLAVTTMQEHAAALWEEGRVAGAVEEERLSRVRHHGWSSQARPGSSLASDPTLCVEEVLCRRAVGALLSPRGLTLDDMDALALNGIPARYRKAYSLIDEDEPMPVLRAGRLVCVPHHLCHAASAWRVSGRKDSWVLTVDGRGERETAAVFHGARGRLRQVRVVLSLTDRSIGGVYETLTRLLGFGPHGQGSVMALASFGNPVVDLSAFLSLRTSRDHSIHEQGLAECFAAFARRAARPPAKRHRDLAASLQAALEKTLLALLKDAGAPQGAPSLCLAGGVALNCRSNSAIRRAFQPRSVFVQPAANDAGTSLGAALEAAAILGGPGCGLLPHAALGPEYSEREAEAALRHAGLPYKRALSVAVETAEILAAGEPVCWFQGRLEFGPRALGRRSILADPRGKEMHARVNRIKDRERWRPFGPSILAGHERDWFEGAFDSRFMLFTLPFKPGRAKRVPAVAHVDGTSRPQSVHADVDPLYHALISEFHRLTGVPMVLNTSFNRRGEPIVCSPSDAVAAFLGMPGAGALVLGPFIARRPTAPAPAAEGDSVLAAAPAGRRLMLRLTARCDSDCVYCSIRDLMHLEDRSFADAARALAEGRRAACSELVIMRGEASLRPDLPELLRRARAMGYRFIQLQTSGRPLARAEVRRELLALVDAFEATVYSADEAVHDAATRSPGSLRQTLMGARAAVAAGREVLLNVPVLRLNLEGLDRVAFLAAKLGARRVQFCFPRPVETRGGVEASPLARLSEAAPRIRGALRAAAAAGVLASTEGVPFCHLEPDQRSGPDSGVGWDRFRVDDLDRLTASLDAGRAEQRPEAPACRRCRLRESCPRTWALYLALFGGAELTPL